MKKRFLAFALAMAMVLAMAACGTAGEENEASSSSESEAAPEFPVEVRDTIIEDAPKGVLSLTPGTTEMLFDMGYGSRVVGVSDYCDWPQEVEQKTPCGSPLSLDREMIDPGTGPAAQQAKGTGSILPGEDRGIQLRQFQQPAQRMKRMKVCPISQGQINFGAVAGGNDHRPQQPRNLTHPVIQSFLLRDSEGEALPLLNAGSGVVHPGHGDMKQNGPPYRLWRQTKTPPPAEGALGPADCRDAPIHTS